MATAFAKEFEHKEMDCTQIVNKNVPMNFDGDPDGGVTVSTEGNKMTIRGSNAAHLRLAGEKARQFLV